MDRIDLFRIYARVVECRSFTRAASQLAMPRSSVSAAVAELEARLGTRLLHRSTRRVVPTDDGEAFHLRCLRLIADVEEAEALFRQPDASPTGVIRIDVPGRIGRRVIAPALPIFFAAHPGLQVDLGVTDRVVNLVEEGRDCALRVGPLADSSLIARSLGELDFINVAAPDYVARYGMPTHPRELGEHRAVVYASASTGRAEEWEWQEAGIPRTRTLPWSVTVNSAEAQIACCLAGLGLIQVPRFDVQAHLRAGELVEVLPEYPAAPAPVNLLYSHRQHLSRRLQVFLGWLQPLLQEQLMLSPAGLSPARRPRSAPVARRGTPTAVPPAT